jgi:hypothetical protein
MVRSSSSHAAFKRVVGTGLFATFDTVVAFFPSVDGCVPTTIKSRWLEYTSMFNVGCHGIHHHY